MPVILGGHGARKTWARGEFDLSLEYVEGECALGIWMRNRKKGERGVAILQPNAHRYVDSKTGMPKGMFIIGWAAWALGKMNRAPSPWAIKALATIVIDYIPDLIEMKPEPFELQKSQPQADVDIRGNHMKVVLH